MRFPSDLTCALFCKMKSRGATNFRKKEEQSAIWKILTRTLIKMLRACKMGLKVMTWDGADSIHRHAGMGRKMAWLHSVNARTGSSFPEWRLAELANNLYVRRFKIVNSRLS